MLHRHIHSPVHLTLDDAPYFITGTIYQRRPLLRAVALKHELLCELRVRFEACGWRLEHWVILDNHYHLIATSRLGEDMPAIMRKLHSVLAVKIHAATGCELPVWWNYWDYCPRDERDYFVHLNYLLYNPVKHGYVADLRDYPYSSFHEHLQNLGRDTMAGQFHAYPEFRSLDIDDDF